MSSNRMTKLKIGAAGVLCVSALAGCRVYERMPWVSTETIVDSDPSIPALSLESADDLYVVCVTVPSGGWGIEIDRSERTPDGLRLFVTIRRPDPAFRHTQAFVDLHALSDVPTNEPIDLVARVLDHGSDPKDRVYARVEPINTLENSGG